MTYDISPVSFWRFPTLRSLWNDDEDIALSTTPSGLSIAEDETHVYVSAALPGVDPKDIEVTFDKGILWIKGDVQSEEKEKKYYRKATASFSYRIAVPGELDQNKEPEASGNNGMMTVTFTKLPKTQPKKITVKSNK